MEENLKKKIRIYTDIYVCIYMYIYLNHFAVHLKLTEHCKSATLQLKKKRNGYVFFLYLSQLKL